MSKCEERPLKKSPRCHATEMTGRVNEGTFMQRGGCHGKRLALARLCKAIMMHEGPLHVYDMIVSDLLAPRGN